MSVTVDQPHAYCDLLSGRISRRNPRYASRVLLLLRFMHIHVLHDLNMSDDRGAQCEASSKTRTRDEL
jgi:hypothetical protein